ncbi:hypothetical protein D3C87_1569870 [compost metagenome]
MFPFPIQIIGLNILGSEIIQVIEFILCIDKTLHETDFKLENVRRSRTCGQRCRQVVMVSGLVPGVLNLNRNVRMLFGIRVRQLFIVDVAQCPERELNLLSRIGCLVCSRSICACFLVTGIFFGSVVLPGVVASSASCQ